MDKIYNVFITRRKELMGIAILMVLLYHLCCWPQWNNPLRIFGHWFFGVDLFLFLSGLGLCFSYEKYKIKYFYYRRFIRIIPLYWFCTIGIYLYSTFLLNNEYTLKQILYSLSTLSFWINTGKEPNWYVSSLIFFYLTFPILFTIVKKAPNISFLLVFIFGLLILKYTEIKWYHDCFISRLPIFMFGIIFYHTIKKKNQ